MWQRMHDGRPSKKSGFALGEVHEVMTLTSDASRWSWRKSLATQGAPLIPGA